MELNINILNRSVLLNKITENKLPVSRQNYSEFNDFRNELHEKFQDKTDDKNEILKKFATNNQARPPGIFEFYGNLKST